MALGGRGRSPIYTAHIYGYVESAIQFTHVSRVVSGEMLLLSHRVVVPMCVVSKWR